MPELPEVEVRPPWSGRRADRAHDRPRRGAAPPPRPPPPAGPRRLRRAARRPDRSPTAPSRQIPLAAARRRRRGAGPPGHERTVPASAAADAPTRRTARVAGRRHRRRAAAPFRRSAHVRRPVAVRGRCRAAAGDRAHRARPVRPRVRPGRRRPAAPAQADRASSGRCWIRRGLGVGNIYADEALWRPGCTMPGRPNADPRRQPSGCSTRPPTVMAAALAAGGTTFDSLYVNVNGDERLLRPFAGRYGRKGSPAPAAAPRSAGRRS